MDAIDRRILECLQADARRPVKTVAAEVGLSRSAVRDRIARLEARGTILGYRVEVAEAEEAAGIGAMLSVRLARTPSPDVVAAVVAMPAVRRCFSLSGEIDLMVEISAAGAEALNTARDAVSRLPGVTGVSTALILKRDKG